MQAMMVADDGRRARLLNSITPTEAVHDAVHFFTALGVTILVFCLVTGIFWVSCQQRIRCRQRHAAAAGAARRHRRRSSRTLTTAVQGSLASRLVCSGVMALLILILQQEQWGSSLLQDDDQYEEDYPNYDLWTVFLYFDGVVAASLVITVSHLIYFNYCCNNHGDEDDDEILEDSDMPPCDDTVVMGDCEGVYDEETSLDGKDDVSVLVRPVGDVLSEAVEDRASQVILNMAFVETGKEASVTAVQLSKGALDSVEN